MNEMDVNCILQWFNVNLYENEQRRKNSPYFLFHCSQDTSFHLFLSFSSFFLLLVWINIFPKLISLVLGSFTNAILSQHLMSSYLNSCIAMIMLIAYAPCGSYVYFMIRKMWPFESWPYQLIWLNWIVFVRK